MAYKTKFKTAQEELIYLKKLAKRLPGYHKGEWVDVESDAGDTYEIRFGYNDAKRFDLRTDSGEELQLNWSGGNIDDFWKFVVDKVLADVIEELDTQPALGVVIRGKHYPIVKV